MRCIVFAILTLPSMIESYYYQQVIYWNVGQGQFSTVLTHQNCYHFDFGGELFPDEVIKICHRRANILILSHEDKDHFNFLKKIASKIEKICILNPTFDPRIPKIQMCSSYPKNIRSIYQTNMFKNKNSNSRIYEFKEQFLFTGDSTKQSEKLWSQDISSGIRYWTVPHHGSNSSTSQEFLNYIPKTSVGIISARFEKYKHPHPKVILRIKAKKIPVLKTQDWGNIRILFNFL